MGYTQPGGRGAPNGYQNIIWGQGLGRGSQNLSRGNSNNQSRMKTSQRSLTKTVATNAVDNWALTIYNPVQLKTKLVLNELKEDTLQKYVDQQK